jgi:hypothetical protein
MSVKFENPRRATLQQEYDKPLYHGWLHGWTETSFVFEHDNGKIEFIWGEVRLVPSSADLTSLSENKKGASDGK